MNIPGTIITLDNDDIACVKAWARHHLHFGGAPLGVTGKVLILMAKAVKLGDMNLKADACDLMEAIDNRYTTTNEPTIVCR
jgi:hypothetical protein